MIPTYHSIDVIKAGETNVWGDVGVSKSITKKGNIRSKTKVVTDTNGKEVVSNYTVLFIGMVNVTTHDTIKFTEPNGKVVEMSPITVKFLRDIDGSVGYTKAVL